jgi:hypothetical protein
MAAIRVELFKFMLPPRRVLHTDARRGNFYLQSCCAARRYTQMRHSLCRQQVSISVSLSARYQSSEFVSLSRHRAPAKCIMERERNASRAIFQLNACEYLCAAICTLKLKSAINESHVYVIFITESFISAGKREETLLAPGTCPMYKCHVTSFYYSKVR